MKNKRRHLASAVFIGMLSLGISLSSLFSCSRVFDNELDKDRLKNPYTGEKRGTQGGQCYSDQTCNEGLYCDGQVCLSPLSFGDGGAVVNEDGSILDQGGAVPMGSLGGLCYPDQTCNVGFTCLGAVCGRELDGGPPADQFVDALST